MDTLVLHVHASSNNTILSLTDANGRVIVNASGGTVGFKKAQRAGFEPAYQATVHIANAVREKAIPVNKVELRLKGFGAGRDAVFKAVHSVTNWAVCRVVDTTPVPFNGCRPKKARRL
ncbi:translational machinery component [Linderina pennispora]|uniref:Translational machinery component n=1 Tax=Linderina pennispora TaxID=61395 RepID=A0A1Y1WNL7_9FUNG|nr:translational machinery component [Linderina pennispora]ORX74888.1 translational machinery component [Linderina pennispora]